MQYFCLSLDGKRPTLTKEQALTSLANLYSRPESHFELHCNHLFDLKKPFILLKNVDKATAEQHQRLLDDIGITATISEMPAAECLSQEAIKERQEEIKKGIKARLKELEALEDEQSAIDTKEQGRKKIIALASVAIITTVTGSLFAVDHFKSKSAEAVDYKIAAFESLEPQLAAARGVSRSDELSPAVVETGAFNDWNKKLFAHRKLEHHLQLLNDTGGMDAVIDRLVVLNDDPLIRITGRMKVANLHLSRSGYSTGEKIKIEEVSYCLLEDNSTLINSLESITDRLYAYLHLGDIYIDSGNVTKAQSAYDIGEKLAAGIILSDEAVEKVIVKTIIAEHLSHKDDLEKSSKYYQAAIKSVNEIDKESIEARWAIPFIVRSMARADQYVSAYSLMEQVEEPAIKELLMNDLASFVSDQKVKRDATSIGLAEIEKLFVDDSEMLLQFENQRFLQEKMRRINVQESNYK